MLTKEEITRRFRLDPESADTDADAIAELQKAGYDRGLAGESTDPEDIEADVGIDVEHIAALLLCEEMPLRRVYAVALAEGQRERVAARKTAVKRGKVPGKLGKLGKLRRRADAAAVS